MLDRTLIRQLDRSPPKLEKKGFAQRPAAARLNGKGAKGTLRGENVLRIARTERRGLKRAGPGPFWSLEGMGMREKMPTPVAATPRLDDLVGTASESISLVDGLIMDAARALFETYGVKLDLDGSPVERTLQSVRLISTIGFSSPTISGSLLLAIPDVVIQQTLPTPDANLADWSGELANQLLGRLKNKLLDYEVAINLALPVVLSGDEFSLPARTRRLTRHFSFVSEWGRMFIRTEMELCPTIELVRQTRPGSKASVDEGESLFF